ncbi:MAG TPA: hypothetical protein VD994_21115, partial [Prosthecobacter sp.]|nr:hypothetical protein [Prosthecobacter sp.]
MKRCQPKSLGMMIAFIAASCIAAEHPHKPTPLETRTFKVPPDFLFHGSAPPVAVPTESQSPLPWEPGIDRKLLANLQSAPLPSSPKEILTSQGVTFPPGAFAIFDPSALTLSVRNTQGNLDVAELFAKELSRYQSRSHSIAVHLIQAPGPLLRSLASNAAAGMNQTRDLEYLLKESTKDGSPIQALHTAVTEVNSGQRCTIESVIEYVHISDLSRDAKGQVSFDADMRPLGFRAEIDAICLADPNLIEVNISSELTLLWAGSRQESVIEPKSGHAVEMPVNEFQSGRTSTSTIVNKGHTRLISVWPAKGDPRLSDQDVCQALFITVHKTTLEQTSDSSALPTLPKDADAMAEHTFAIPPGLFGGEQDRTRLDLLLPPKHIKLPQGSKLTIGSPHRLSVKTTAEFMPVVEASIDRLLNVFPKTLNMTVEILRGPSSIIRPLLMDHAPRIDHRSAWEKLHEARIAGMVKLVDLAHFGTRLNEKVKFQSHLNRHTLYEITWQNGQQPAISTEHRPSGFILKIDTDSSPSSEAHEIGVSCNLERHFSPPTLSKEILQTSQHHFSIPRDQFHVARVQSYFPMMNGATRIIGAWRPVTEGGMIGEDILEVALMTCHIVRHLPDARHAITNPPPRVPPPAPPASLRKDSSGMYTRSFRVAPDFMADSVSPLPLSE